MPHIVSIVQGVIFALSEGPPAVMELLTHTEYHLTEDFPSGSTQFNLLQFQKVQCCCKKFLQMRGEKPLMGQGDKRQANNVVIL